MCVCGSNCAKRCICSLANKNYLRSEAEEDFRAELSWSASVRFIKCTSILSACGPGVGGDLRTKSKKRTLENAGISARHGAHVQKVVNGRPGKVRFASRTVSQKRLRKCAG